jgi:hypothetical protein
VYEHAAGLGPRRLDSGPRARLRFSLVEVDEALVACPLRGLEDARLLLMLAPWPPAGHNAATEAPNDQRLPANATVERIDPPRSEWRRGNTE